MNNLKYPSNIKVGWNWRTQAACFQGLQLVTMTVYYWLKDRSLDQCSSTELRNVYNWFFIMLPKEKSSLQMVLEQLESHLLEERSTDP